jgi:hypothetical protein
MNKEIEIDIFEGLDENEDILRGLDEPKYRLRRRRHTAGAQAGGGTIVLSPPFLTIADSATIGTIVGTPSVVGGTGTYTFTMSDPSGQFTILGGNIVVASALTPGTYPVTITATGSMGDTINLNTTITVTHSGYVPTYFIYGF